MTDSAPLRPPVLGVSAASLAPADIAILARASRMGLDSYRVALAMGYPHAQAITWQSVAAPRSASSTAG